MKYQTEYQRNFQRRTPKRSDDPPAEPRRLIDVPMKRSSSSSPSRRRAQTALFPAQRKSTNFAVIGPNDKFANSQLYRLRQPVENPQPVVKPKEYAILGRNEKFHDNVAYPLRKPIAENPSATTRRRQHSENHSCGIQTESESAPHVSFDPRHGREVIPARSRLGVQSEYQQQFNWKKPMGDAVGDQMLVDDAKVRDRRSDPVLPLSVIDPSEKILHEKAPIPIHAAPYVEPEVLRPISIPMVERPSSTIVPTKKEVTSEYQSKYKTIVDQKKPKTRKAFEAEQAEERKRKEMIEAERAHTDDEGTGGNHVSSGKEFQQKHLHGNLRRWKSEYQTTFKPFWRFDYKNGKWYKDAEAEQAGFNPNLFWYKEVLSNRKQANEFRANAEADHFSRDHTLQLQTGQGAAKNFLAWDAQDDDDTISVHSTDRNYERERQQEIEMKRSKNDRLQTRIHYERERQQEKIPSTTRSDQTVETDRPVERVVYIDNPPPKPATVATKALVRNLNSSSVQQHMTWDTKSLNSERTDTDTEFKLNIGRDLQRKHYVDNDDTDDTAVKNDSVPNGRPESRGIALNIPIEQERPMSSLGFPTSHVRERSTRHHTTNHSEALHPAGRASYDTHMLDRRAPPPPSPVARPQTSNNDYRPYTSNSRYRDESDDHHSQAHTPASKASFQAHVNALDRRYDQTYQTHQRDDDVLSLQSARSLSSTCSLASQTYELANKNLQKFWGDNRKKPV